MSEEVGRISGKVPFGKLPEEKKRKRAKEREDEVFEKYTPSQEIQAEKKVKVKVSQKVTEKRKRNDDVITQTVTAEELPLGKSKQLGPVTIAYDLLQPEETMEQLLSEIEKRQETKKENEVVAIFFTGKNLKVQTVSLREVDTDFYTALTLIEEPLAKLSEKVANDELRNKFNKALQEIRKPLIRNQVSQIDTTLKEIDKELAKYKGKEEQKPKIQGLFIGLRNLIFLQFEYGKESRQFDQYFEAAKDLQLMAKSAGIQVVEIPTGKKIPPPPAHFMSEVLRSGFIGFEDPEFINSLLTDEDTLYRFVREADQKDIAEVVRNHPEILRKSYCPDRLFKDFRIIYNAVIKDPTIILDKRVVIEDKELAKKLAKETLASLILGEHDEKILATADAIKKECKKYLPTVDAKGFETEEEMSALVIQLRSSQTMYDENGRKNIFAFSERFLNPSYNQFIASLELMNDIWSHGGDLIGRPPLEDVNMTIFALTTRFPIYRPEFKYSDQKTLLLLNSQDRDVTKKVLEASPDLIMWADSSFQLDPEFKEKYLKALKDNIRLFPDLYLLPLLQKEVKEDAKFIESVLEVQPLIYKDLSPELQKNEKITTAFIKGLRDTFSHYSARDIRIDDQGRRLIDVDGFPTTIIDIVAGVYPGIRNQPLFAERIVKELFSDTEWLKENEDFILFAKPEIQNLPEFKEILHDAIRSVAENNSYILRAPFISQEMKYDKEFMCDLLDRQPKIYHDIVPQLKEDKDVISALIRGMQGKIPFDITVGIDGALRLDGQTVEVCFIDLTGGVKPQESVWNQITEKVFNDETWLASREGNKRYILFTKPEIQAKLQKIFSKWIKIVACENLNILKSSFFPKEMRLEIFQTAMDHELKRILVEESITPSWDTSNHFVLTFPDGRKGTFIQLRERFLSDHGIGKEDPLFNKLTSDKIQLSKFSVPSVFLSNLKPESWPENKKEKERAIYSYCQTVMNDCILSSEDAYNLIMDLDSNYEKVFKYLRGEMPSSFDPKSLNNRYPKELLDKVREELIKLDSDEPTLKPKETKRIR